MKLINGLSLTVLVLVTGALATLIQSYFYVDAGKSKQNNRYQYQFQLNYWNEEIHRKFNDLSLSEVSQRMLLSKGKTVVDTNFFKDIKEYHFLVTELLRPLEFKSQVGFNLLSDIDSVKGKGFNNISDYQRISKDIKKYEYLLDEFFARKKRLETFLPELVSSFNYENDMSDSDKIDLTGKQIKLLKELLTDEALFVQKEPDPFKLIRELGDASYVMLDNYEKVIDGYNKEVSSEDTIKKLTLFILVLISLYLSIRIAIKEEKPTTYGLKAEHSAYQKNITRDYGVNS